MFIKQFVVTQNRATEAGKYIHNKISNEDGEVSSYMIVLAMLVGVAAFAKSSLDQPLRQKVTDVKNSLN